MTSQAAQGACGSAATYGLVIGHEPSPTNENWGFVLAGLICAKAG